MKDAWPRCAWQYSGAGLMAPSCEARYLLMLRQKVGSTKKTVLLTATIQANIFQTSFLLVGGGQPWNTPPLGRGHCRNTSDFYAYPQIQEIPASRNKCNSLRSCCLLLNFVVFSYTLLGFYKHIYVLKNTHAIFHKLFCIFVSLYNPFLIYFQDRKYTATSSFLTTVCSTHGFKYLKT